MKCPHCKAQTIAHEGAKEGYFHCNNCGCCLDKDGVMYPGHPVCKESQTEKPVRVARAQSPSAEAEPVETEKDE